MRRRTDFLNGTRAAESHPKLELGSACAKIRPPDAPSILPGISLEYRDFSFSVEPLTLTTWFHDPGTQEIIPAVYQPVIYSRANIRHGREDIEAEEAPRGCGAVLCCFAAAVREHDLCASHRAGGALLLRMRVRRRRPLPSEILRNSEV